MSRFGGVPINQEGPKSRFGGVFAAPGKSGQQVHEEEVTRENREKGFFQNLGEGLARGAESRVLGMIQAGTDMLPDSVVSQGFRDDLKTVAKDINARGKGTGVGGFAGEIVGDPLTAATLPVAGARTVGALASQGAKIGAAGGFTAPLEEGGFAKRLVNTAVGAGTGAAVPVALEGGKAVVTKAAGVLSPFQTKGMADRKAQGTIAKLLKEEGLTSTDVQLAARQGKVSGVAPDLAESTGSKSLLAVRKNIAGGTGKAAADMSRAVAERNETAIPKALTGLADPLRTKGQDGLSLLQATLQKSGAQPVKVDDLVTEVLEKASKTNPKNAEGKIYQAVLDELEFAEKNGNTFEALHRAKQALDNIYIEGADDALRSRASSLTYGIRKAINDRLRKIDPDYAVANRKLQAGMVAYEIESALASTNEGSIAALYNKLWAKPEMRHELQRQLDPGDFGQISRVMEQLKKVKAGGMGGSDTEARQITRAAMNDRTGLPLLEEAADLSRGSVAGGVTRRISDAVRQKDLQAIQRQITSPDAAAIADRMKAGTPAVPGVTSKAATATAVTATSRPEDKPNDRSAHPNLPPGVRTPKSEQSSLMDRIGKAESGNNPNAKNPNSSASGRFQFTDGTWALAVAKFGKQLGVDLKDKNDDEAQKKMALALARDNIRVMQPQLGRDLTEGDLYVAHFLGAGDAVKLLKAQGTGREAVTLFPRKVVSSNRSIFFKGDKPRTVEEVYALLESKVSKG